MNICDDPNHVSVYEAWREGDVIQRVPIIVTGNDLSQIFAPLVRDGRMSKFYWKPGRHDLSCILHQMYKVRRHLQNEEECIDQIKVHELPSTCNIKQNMAGHGKVSCSALACAISLRLAHYQCEPH